MSLAKEFEIGIQFDHPNIRRTIGLETIKSLGRVIVLEYIDGSPLESLLASPSLTMSAARTIAAQIADALRYVHSKQVYHRDIKPANILVWHNGNVVKIIDFSLSDSEDFIILKNPSGSRRYMAPELSGPDVRPSAVADIYSFGVVIDELASATGDDQLAEAVKKCTDTNPDKRLQSLAYLRLPSPHPSVTERMERFLSSRVLTYMLICTITALGAMIIFLLTQNI